MDKTYADTVRLLLNVAPDVFRGDIFALKGGTAINLFVRDMPRLSVDLDLVYTPWQTPRATALKGINAELDAIGKRLIARGLRVHKVTMAELGDIKLMVNSDRHQVKVEVNPVFRGTVLDVERRSLVASTADKFAVELELPVLAIAELYGSKLVAAMDRQHPRDLFDVWQMYQTEGLTDDTVECFVTYLAGHNRPTPHVLFGNRKNIEQEFTSTFVGMTTEPVSLDTLLSARDRLFKELPGRLTELQRRFLLGFTRAEPDWSLLQCPHAGDLPALKWKLLNLKEFKKKKPDEFNSQAAELESKLW